MNLTIKLFAAFREAAGTEEIDAEIGDGATVGDLIEHLNGDGPLAGKLAPDTFIVAVDQVYASPQDSLAEGAEVALIPPVSGGSGEQVRRCSVGPEPVSADDLDSLVRDDAAGATITFMGTTRDVPTLSYEAYGPMATRVLQQIAETAITEHGLCAVAIHHRTGDVAIQEASIGIAVSAPHRPEAYAGSRAIIDAIKQQAPIWKVEIDHDGTATRVAGNLPVTGA